MRKLVVLIAGTVIGLLFLNSGAISSLASRILDIRNSNEEAIILPEKDLERFATVIADVKKYYYKTIPDEELFTQAISGMLTNLDPHSSYLKPEDLKDLEMETLGKFGGIGVEVIPEQGAIRVVSPLDDTPAFKAGIQAGDYIVQINKKLVRDMTLREAINMMRGKKGTNLQLTILRKNVAKPLVVNLKRQTISIESIKSKMLAPGYAYIRLALFQEPTEKYMVRAIKRMQKQTKSKGGLKGLILDVRNNPGGLFESSVEIADDFLDSTKMKGDKLIVYTKGQGEEAQITAKATPGDILPGVPIVVLINEGSASAAEIVAGALQDHKRAIVVGTRSFGKGSVQTLIPIDRTSAIKLTTALYYTPSGRSIQAKGIEPNITVADIMLAKEDKNDQEIPRVDEASLIDHIQNGDSKEKDKDEFNRKQKKAELELAHKDFQLYEALHILKSQSVMQNNR